MTLRFSLYLSVILIAFIIGAVRYRRLTAPFKYLTVLVGFSFLSEVTSRILAHTIKSSMPVYHIICIIHFILFSIIYHYLLKSGAVNKIIVFMIFFFTAFAIFNTIQLQSFESFPSNSILISQAIYIIYALALFLQMLAVPIFVPLSKQSVFWLNISVLVFSSTIFFNLGLINYFHRHDINTKLLDTIIYIVSLSFYGFFGIALLLDNKEGPFTKINNLHEEQ
jgi:hypothetical protein